MNGSISNLIGKIPFRCFALCGQIRGLFGWAKGIYPSYPLTAPREPSKIKAFLLLIVRTDAVFCGRCLFSAFGVRSLRRTCNTLPGWNQAERLVRRQRIASYLPDTAAPFPAADLMAGQPPGTTYIAANRKCSGHRHIPLHHPARYSFRRHSYSIYVPAFAPGGIAYSP